MKYRLFMMLMLLILLTACQPNQETEVIDQPDIPQETQPDNSNLIELTLEELSYYDGKEGRPAYIAVSGNIYDVTDSAFWRSGNHNGYAAGQDLTDAIINDSPHGVANLSRVPLIGRLKNGE